MVNRCKKAGRKRLSKGFKEDLDGMAGHSQDIDQDINPDTPGQGSGHEADLPVWMSEVATILRTKGRDMGEYTAAAIAEVCIVDDSTIRNRWFKAINSELADEDALKVNGKFTELAMALFAHVASCRDKGLNPAEWVLQVLRPALASAPQAQAIDPDEYQTALARREQSNDAESKALEIRWAEMRQRREQEVQTRQQLSDADLERIRLEEKSRLLAEVNERDRIRRELMKEMGLL
ncbi:MAG: hypothetical protein AAGE59_30630 [Cyanobacteria bacterium P01_F01_bin.86]